MSSGLVLNTNVNSLVAQNALSSSGTQLAQALEQLSTGLRINTAADDPAGYAIVNGMTSQINGLNQAVQNANDGVSLAQTASGALSEIVNDLQSMRDLAVESLNATNSSSDRVDLNAQYQQLMADINSVSSQTEFNGVNLLNGTFQGATFQVGADAGQSITMSAIASAGSDNLGQLYTAQATDPAAYTDSGEAGGTSVQSGDTGTFAVTFNGDTYTTSAVTLTGTQSTDLTNIAAAINQAVGSAGLVATVDSTGAGINLNTTTPGIISASYTPTTGNESLATFGLSAQNVVGALYTYTGSNVTSGDYAADVPAAYVSDSTGPSGDGDVTQDDSNNAVVSLSINVDGTLYTTSPISLTGSEGTDATTVATAIGNATNSNGQKLSAAGISATVDDGNSGIDLYSTSNVPVSISMTSSDSGTADPTTLSTFGIDANPTWTANYDTATLTVNIGDNSYQTQAVDLTGNQATDLTNLAAAINDVISSSGVTAVADTSNGSVDFSSATPTTGITVSATFAGQGNTTDNPVEPNGKEDLTTFGFDNTGDLANSDAATVAISNFSSATASTSALNSTSVLTVDSSNIVLISIDEALQQLATMGADLGAYQNRFQAAVTGLQTDSTNLSSARSSIEDTDYAQATSQLTEAQILQQAGTAMVAQANTIPQNVLTLLDKLP